MHTDILIFAVIAAVLIYRLNAVLGTRHGQERERPNPFAPVRPVPERGTDGPVIDVVPAAPAPVPAQIIDAAANADGSVATGLAEIAAADAGFDAGVFLQGARQAFQMIVEAYAAGDLATLRPLLSPRLLADFESVIRARAAAGQTAELKVHGIRDARLAGAHMGGVMAYVTVDYDVEETTVTRDAGGQVVTGDPDCIATVRDVWTFSRDTRAADPNWILIETRAGAEGAA